MQSPLRLIQERSSATFRHVLSKTCTLCRVFPPLPDVVEGNRGGGVRRPAYQALSRDCTLLVSMLTCAFTADVRARC